MDFKQLQIMLREAPEPTVIEVREELYDLISESAVADIIRKHWPETKITNTLLERYQAEAKARTLTADKVVLELRKLNPADAVFENHVEYCLDDGNVVVITEEMDQRLNNILREHSVVLHFMRESTENFMYVVNELEE